MPRTWPFTRLFTVSFAVITALTVIVFIVVGLRIIDHFFSYYVDEIHKETQNMLVMQAETHYKMYGTWKGYGPESGVVAKLSGDYFTITDNHGDTVYSSEKDVERCCVNRNHVYTQVRYPLLLDGKQIGELTAGYFTNHISSPEADAFRGGGVSLVILAIICICASGALVSLIFFYRLSKPVRDIAVAARAISEGHLQSRVAIQSNVAELHEIADAINALSSSLLSQENFRQQLIVTLSHELRTPLQILLNQIEGILDGLHPADTLSLESMHAQVTLISELLNELEDRLIYENDTFELNVAPTDISEITRKVALSHKGGFAQKGLQFDSAIEPEIVIMADSVRFAQVLINLLSNALKYTAEGGVSLSLKRAGDCVELVIADTGEGMAAEIMENISNRSGQAFKDVNSKGVGLYIAKLIIDKHGWKLSIHSEADAGTRISVLMK